MISPIYAEASGIVCFWKMGFTSGQLAELKSVIKETVTEVLVNDEVLSKIADKVSEKINLIQLKTDVQQVDLRVSQIEGDNEKLKMQLNNCEQFLKRNNIRIIGVEETDHEETVTTVSKLLKEKLDIEEDVKYDVMYRIGGSLIEDRPRQIFLRLGNYEHKKIIMQRRRRLKGTGVVIVEDLTGYNYSLLKKAREELGKRNLWTVDGTIFTKVGKDKYIVKTDLDIEKIKQALTTRNKYKKRK